MSTKKVRSRDALDSLLYALFGFVPFANSLFLFRMNDAARKKPWRIVAWAAFGMNTAVLAVFCYALLWPDLISYESARIELYCLITCAIVNLLVWMFLISQRSVFLHALSAKGRAKASEGRPRTAEKSAFLFLGLVPFVNSLVLFRLFGRTGKKLWQILAWVLAFLNTVLFYIWLMLDTTYNVRDFLQTFCPIALIVIQLLCLFLLQAQRADLMRAYANANCPERSKGAKWTFQKTFWMLFGFVPFVNSILLFHMNGLVSKRKWRILAWSLIGLNTALILLWIAGRYNNLDYIALVCFLFVNFMTWYYFASQRSEFLRALAKRERIDEFIEGLDEERIEIPEVPKKPEEPKGPEGHEETEEAEAPEPPAVLDLNTATEDELSALPGLTIVDVKRAVEHRDAHGGFRSVDDFFDVIRAKPHIIAHLRNVLTAVPKHVEPKPPKQDQGAGQIDDRPIDIPIDI